MLQTPCRRRDARRSAVTTAGTGRLMDQARNVHVRGAIRSVAINTCLFRARNRRSCTSGLRSPSRSSSSRAARSARRRDHVCDRKPRSLCGLGPASPVESRINPDRIVLCAALAWRDACRLGRAYRRRRSARSSTIITLTPSSSRARGCAALRVTPKPTRSLCTHASQCTTLRACCHSLS